jgi:hypothetical protein
MEIVTFATPITKVILLVIPNVNPDFKQQGIPAKLSGACDFGLTAAISCKQTRPCECKGRDAFDWQLLS